MNLRISAKRLQVDRTQSRLMIVIAVATIITVFCLVSTKALLAQASHQRRLINERRDAASQLKENVKSANALIDYYNQVFEGSSPTNVIGGKNDPNPGAVPPNGTNGNIVLDALPSSYDYPALITSLAKIFNDNRIGSPSVQGSDESATVNSDSESDPKPVPIKVPMSGSSTYGSVRALINDLERSVRPFDITSLQFRGTEAQMVVTLNATTYYQPAKSLTIGTKEVK